MMNGLIFAFLASLCSFSGLQEDSIFVESGITYRILDANTVNITFQEDVSYRSQTFRDSLLEIPARVRHLGRNYRVKSIEANAFVTWVGIKHVKISNGIEELHDGCFSACANLESISISSSVGVIGEHVLSYCINLTSIHVDKDNSKFDSREDCNAIIRKSDDYSILLYGCKSTKIPSSVKAIYSNAYVGCLMEEMDIPEGVEEICSYAFLQCRNLKSVYIPASVSDIHPEVFAHAATYNPSW